MQLCYNCNHENMEGVLFCERCGVALSAVSVGTKQLEGQDANQAARGQYLSEEHIIMIHLANRPDPIMLRVEGDVVLGRAGTEADGVSVVNLENFNAVELGVSRRHALLTRRGLQLFLQDLNSTNASYLNGEKITPGHDYALRDGDEISLGRMKMRIFFK